MNTVSGHSLAALHVLGTAAGKRQGERSINADWKGRLRRLERGPLVLGGLSAKMVRGSRVPVTPPDLVELVTGVGCAHAGGVSIGVPIDWFRMPLGTTLVQRILALPVRPIRAVVGLEIARSNKAVVAQGHWPPSDTLLRIAATHLTLFRKYNEWLKSGGKAYADVLPRVIYDLDADFLAEEWYRAAEFARLAVERQGLVRRAVPYSVRQDILFDAVFRRIRQRNSSAALLKVGWAIADRSEQGADLVDRHERLTAKDASGCCSLPGGDEAAFDVLSVASQLAIYREQMIGYAYLPAPGALHSSQPDACPYTAKPLKKSGDSSLCYGRPIHARLLVSKSEWPHTRALLDRSLDPVQFERAEAPQRRSQLAGLKSQVDLFEMWRLLAPGAFDCPDSHHQFEDALARYEKARQSAELAPPHKQRHSSTRLREKELDLLETMGRVLRSGVEHLVEVFGPNDREIGQEAKRLRSSLAHFYS